MEAGLQLVELGVSGHVRRAPASDAGTIWPSHARACRAAGWLTYNTRLIRPDTQNVAGGDSCCRCCHTLDGGVRLGRNYAALTSQKTCFLRLVCQRPEVCEEKIPTSSFFFFIGAKCLNSANQELII